MGKKFIAVTADFTSEGLVTPRAIKWEDGRIFEVDRITDRRKAASLKAGGVGIKYCCIIRGKQVNLFKDEDIWFMETDRNE